MISTGNHLRAARLLAGLSQADLAQLAGVNTNTISSMELKRGNPLSNKLSTVLMVARALDGAGIEILDDGMPGCQLRAKTASCTNDLAHTAPRFLPLNTSWGWSRLLLVRRWLMRCINGKRP